MPTPTKNKVTEQPTRKIVPEIDITQLQQQQQQQQHEQQQNEQQQKKFRGSEKT